MSNDEQALKEKIRPVMEDLVYTLVSEKPEDPVEYMINYLEKREGFTSNGITLDEKRELEELRKEIVKYRQLDEESKAKKKEETGSTNLDNYTTNPNDKSLTDDEDDEDDIDNTIENKVFNAKARLSKQREGVSAEAYGVFNIKSDFTPKVVKKSDDQIQRIKARVLQSFLFAALESKDLDIVISTMEEKRYNKGDDVIVQYESGDCLFVVEEGELDCYRKAVSFSYIPY